MTAEPISAEAWRQAATEIAILALEANKRDEFETANALRVLAIAGFQMEDEMKEKK